MFSIIERRRKSNRKPRRDLSSHSTQRIRKILNRSPLELAIKPLGEMIQSLLEFNPAIVKEMVNIENPLVRKILIAELLESSHASNAVKSRESLMEMLQLT